MPNTPADASVEGSKHMMLISAVGDFTCGLRDDPPKSLWTRALRHPGLPYLLNMYRCACALAFITFTTSRSCNADLMT